MNPPYNWWWRTASFVGWFLKGENQRIYDRRQLGGCFNWWMIWLFIVQFWSYFGEGLVLYRMCDYQSQRAITSRTWGWGVPMKWVIQVASTVYDPLQQGIILSMDASQEHYKFESQIKYRAFQLNRVWDGRYSSILAYCYTIATTWTNWSSADDAPGSTHCHL